MCKVVYQVKKGSENWMFKIKTTHKQTSKIKQYIDNILLFLK